MLNHPCEKGSTSTRLSWNEMDESTVITSLKEGTQYKFLGVLENLKQDDKLALKIAAKVF